MRKLSKNIHMQRNSLRNSRITYLTTIRLP